MQFHQNAMPALGGDSFPAENGDTLGGVTKRLIGGSVTRGQIVRAATNDADPLLDAGKAVGPGSIGTTVQTLGSEGGAVADKAAYGLTGEFFVALEDVAEDAEGRFGDVGVFPCSVTVPDGGLGARVPLMPDFATGNLVEADDTAKPIALTNVKIADAAGGSAVTGIHPCRFRGTDGWR